ncbi:hypothetical protein [Microcoleus sp. PH2017_05_CCC_O_A]|uniref:hypothetical protein n=1 Tax=Microcoleus sp. PH2017_05_CCC_O_A TaxID=2798816 RepID=UPI001DD87229|nr:hypothetical protein [Microcoleus sp. PH2017_05_CCC_O_A]MCC3438859.1 hypothetical protein [Microcoleus sp. PH2017_05_CCC_O_A]
MAERFTSGFPKKRSPETSPCPLFINKLGPGQETRFGRSTLQILLNFWGIGEGTVSGTGSGIGCGIGAGTGSGTGLGIGGDEGISGSPGSVAGICGPGSGSGVG